MTQTFHAFKKFFCVSEASIADRPTLLFDTAAIPGGDDDKETCPRYTDTDFFLSPKALNGKRQNG